MIAPFKKRISRLIEFIQLESFSGILLGGATILALLIANSKYALSYQHFIHTDLMLSVGDFSASSSLGHFVNDALMAIFFFVVGLELKREFQDGALSLPSQRLLPCVTAVFGVIVPAIIYLFFNYSSGASHGWAIPCATDIAFSLAVLTLVKVPLPLKIFLSTLAIVDDLIAILIIAIFYSSSLDLFSLFIVGCLFLSILIISQMGVRARLPYLFLGVFLWSFLLTSGIHATLAGVLLAIATPRSMIIDFEHIFHPWVAYLILPLFAFCNAGLNLSQFSSSLFFAPVSLGIFFGLLLGKPIGIFGSALALKKLFSIDFGEGITVTHMLGASVLAGIGFTMSIFISGLAFTSGDFSVESRVAILTASLIASVVGLIVLKASADKV